jgi:hypothetical protein
MRNGEDSNVEKQNRNLRETQAEDPEELEREDELLAKL